MFFLLFFVRLDEASESLISLSLGSWGNGVDMPSISGGLGGITRLSLDLLFISSTSIELDIV